MGSDPETVLLTEIFDIILNDLNDDVSSLKACHLVNEAWNQASEPRLFRTIRVNGDHGDRNSSTFVIFLSNNPRLSSCV